MSLKQLRLDRGLTQKEMAKFLECTQVTYFRYENGEREPTIAQLKK
ncbi:MAG: helix-turn-helix transcriptional regulator, partial [Spirochaetales bacterium]|nr:helix-turn-helix transcriptional regulator [Spirochaetales bacterium]